MNEIQNKCRTIQNTIILITKLLFHDRNTFCIIVVHLKRSAGNEKSLQNILKDFWMWEMVLWDVQHRFNATSNFKCCKQHFQFGNILVKININNYKKHVAMEGNFRNSRIYRFISDTSLCNLQRSILETRHLLLNIPHVLFQ